ncbi:MAG: rhodanese-like domain-containing protein [Bdellovibrionaceae bacterium]|nr:rhodanese-like domain-containing protein [Pseudobdellovibrionaceae bacterium]MBX3035174.1 rhodanese-like domain-containing protein [Pseudobdellovibrionaceae bacterium]
MLDIQNNGGIPEVHPLEVNKHHKDLRVIDVRRSEEFTGELGHIPGAELVTLGPELVRFLENGARDELIVFVCLAGGRSAQATAAALQLGFTSVVNMTGGMKLWNDLGLPTEK